MGINNSNLNLDLITTRLKEIQIGLTYLKKYKEKTEEDFLASYEGIAASKYELIVIIEAASSICNHISVRKGNRIPETYADCYKVLEELQIIDDELCKRLQMMARFRNLLVHRYHKIDNERVFRILGTQVDDLSLFIESIKDYIQS